MAVGFCGLHRKGLGRPKGWWDRTEVLIPRPKLQHQREASAPSPCTVSRFSRQRSCKGRVNSSFAWSDQESSDRGPVPPLPSQVVLETQAHWL